jgi:hypothetical protein
LTVTEYTCRPKSVLSFTCSHSFCSSAVMGLLCQVPKSVPSTRALPSSLSFDDLVFRPSAAFCPQGDGGGGGEGAGGGG